MKLRQRLALIDLAIRHYRVTLKKLRGAAARRLRRRPPPFPELISFFLFHGCNLRCAMCGQWRRGEVSERHRLPLGKLREIIDEAAKHRPEIYVWGGEPTLHPDFAPFIRHVKQRGLVCTVNTNGTMLQAQAEEIVDARVDSLDISLDGPAEIHDAIRGVAGTYARVMAGMERVRCLAGGRHPLMKAIITLSDANIGHVEALLADIEANPAVDMSIIQLGWYVTSDSGQRYSARMQREFAVPGASWAGFLDEGAGDRAAAVRALAGRVRSGDWRKPVMFFPELSGQEIERYYANHSDTLGGKACLAVDRGIHIRGNGEVVICGDFPDVVIGNVNEAKVQEVWNGPRLQAFRASLRERGLLPICQRCCGFFR